MPCSILYATVRSATAATNGTLDLTSEISYCWEPEGVIVAAVGVTVVAVVAVVANVAGASWTGTATAGTGRARSNIVVTGCLLRGSLFKHGKSIQIIHYLKPKKNKNIFFNFTKQKYLRHTAKGCQCTGEGRAAGLPHHTRECILHHRSTGARA